MRITAFIFTALVVGAIAQSCSILDNTDYVANDNSGSAPIVTLYGIPSAESCCTSCATFEECQYFSWVKSNQQCYLKNENVKVATNTGTKGGKIARAPPSRSGLTCNEVLPGYDYNNGFITSGAVSDLNGCCNFCRNYSTCAYYTYVNSNKMCYLKASSSSKTANSGTTVGSVVPARATLRTGKRGVAWFNSASCSDLRKLTNVKWIYNWAPQPPAGLEACINELGLEYIPMQWGLPLALDRIYTKSKYLLTFNEPNFQAQSWIMPADAAAVWPQIEAFAATNNMQISSPSAAAGGQIDAIKWLDWFFGNCTLKYGASKGCKVDFITTHIYNCQAAGINGFTALFKKYNKPIWLTEFACPAVEQGKSVSDVAQFVKDTLAYLEADSQFVRYSWFGTRIENTDGWLGPQVNLFDNTQSALSPVGTAYNNYASSSGSSSTTGNPATAAPATPKPATAAPATPKPATAAPTPATPKPATPKPATAAPTPGTPAPTTKPATPKPATSAPPTPTPSGSTYVGCYIDSTTARDLTTAGPVSPSANTVDKCRYYCGLRNFSYAGLQYGQECFCGNRYGSLGVAPASDCNMPCTGNSAQICGAGDRNSVYKSGPSGYLGCYIDGSPRVMSSSTASDTMTIDICRQSCAAKNNKYAGLQYGRECWCGDAYATLGKADESSCNMKCAGDATEICGAGNRNSVYSSLPASSYPGY